MKKSLITSRDPKGLQIAGLLDAVLNKKKYDENQAQRIVEKGGKFQDGIEKLMDELSAPEPVRLWREKDGVISFTVKSDGATGLQWIKRLKEKGFRISRWAEDVLKSPEFKPTSGVTTEIVVLTGKLFSDNERITHKIRADAERRKLTKPNPEVACLIREMFTDEEIAAMGLWWIAVFHESIKDSGGDPDLLRAYRYGDGLWLDTLYDRPDSYWGQRSGFAFAAGK